jgi:hypothetical protein
MAWLLNSVVQRTEFRSKKQEARSKKQEVRSQKPEFKKGREQSRPFAFCGAGL